MRLHEILNEDNGSTPASQGNKSKKQGKSGNMHDHYQSAIKSMETYTDNNSYYTMYRFGVDMAGGPKKDHRYDPVSPVGNQMATVAYTDADQSIIDSSKKNLGLKSKRLTSKDSSETPNTNKLSPVAKIKRNKYGV